ncbi:MAG: CPBP family intramembrane glutamic endopeptidase [Methylomonas sp.]|jgi:membrane protease YdiL (CAAX protease family)
MRAVFYALLPLAGLAGLIVLASVLSYGLLILTGDILGVDKLIGKITQLLLILCIFPLKKYLRLQWRDFGFAPPAIFFKQIWQGLALSIVTLLPMLLILYALDVHVFDEGQNWTAGKLAGKISLALILALLIAFFEEMLFRGLLLTAFRRQFTTTAAILISSFYYAALHFLKSKSSISYPELSFGGGFQLILEAFGNWLNPAIAGALLSLFIVGVFLAVIRTRIPDSLGLCIGCHCGWVWQIKTSKDLCNLNPHADYQFLVSNYDGVVGPLVSFWLLLAIMVFEMYRKRKKTLG